MNVYEIMQSSGAVLNCTRKREREIATELLRDLVAKAYEEGRKSVVHLVPDAILNNMKGEAFERGIKAALEELHDVYGEGLEETDLWAEYMNEGAGE